MKVLYAASEAAPFYKTGGLGDVAGALPKALQAQGDDVRVVVPYYADKFPDAYRNQVVDLRWFTVWINDHDEYVGVKSLVVDGVTYYLIDNRGYFAGSDLYGHWNDGERFAFFQLAVLELMQEMDFVPDVLHVNDWHTAMIPVLLKTTYAWQKPLQAVKTVLTIHNMQFQGWYSAASLRTFFGLDETLYHEGPLRFENNQNWLKSGIVFADYVNTVSPTYAQEIQTPAFGEKLEGVLRMYSGKLSGIVNGVDTNRYNPATDSDMPVNFSLDDLTGKAASKRALQAEFGLPEKADTPVYVMVSRLTRQKGVDLLIDALPYFLQTHDAQVIVLGTGDYELEQRLLDEASQFPQQLKVQIAFDVHLAQRLYGGADVFLMPSAFEPCGISQMMAQLYGTLPLVHEVGGLIDTVEPYNEFTGAGTGFGFSQFDSGTLGWTMDYAYQIYKKHPEAWANLKQQAMQVDVSWRRSAQAYHAIYDRIQDWK
jgi:starch synthase